MSSALIPIPSALRFLAAISMAVAALAVGALAAAPTAGAGAVGAASPAAADAGEYVPGEVIVGYAPGDLAAFAASAVKRMGLRPAASPPVGGEQVMRLPQGVSVSQEIARLRRQPGVTYAAPNYIAHIAGSWIPNDPGRAGVAGGWQKLQWNFLAADGVNAPQAWANLRADHRPGGRGVVVAILDTGVAYRNWRQFRKSPDFAGTRFVDPYDFIAHNRLPLDREGHGTFVAGTVAEATDNRLGLTGLAYRASIMPVRVLDADGTGDAATIAKGVRYAVTHGAQVINLSLEFDISIRPGDIPDILSAIRFAHSRGVVVVAASGNEGVEHSAYPARAPPVISVGATTRDRCLADYSNGGTHLALVAPGGGDDSSVLSDPNCHPGRHLPDIFQMTFNDPGNPRRFGLPGDWFGTSMAAPHVSAVAALVIASGVLGPHPSPDRVLRRLEQTATPLGGSTHSDNYGYGLINAGAATAPLVPRASKN
jgi:serine protease